MNKNILLIMKNGLLSLTVINLAKNTRITSNLKNFDIFHGFLRQCNLFKKPFAQN